jgi:hypothetical protein
MSYTKMMYGTFRNVCAVFVKSARVEAVKEDGKERVWRKGRAGAARRPTSKPSHLSLQRISDDLHGLTTIVGYSYNRTTNVLVSNS